MSVSATRRLTLLSLRASKRSFSTTSTKAQRQPWSDPIPPKAKLNKYVIIAEDHSDSSALSRRLEVRERHLEQAAAGKEVGRILLGGAILRRDFSEIDEEAGPTSSMAGSVLIVQGESIEDVRERLSRDEYVKGKVFDPSKTRILPFLQATTTSSTSPLLTPSRHANTLSETTKMGTRTRLPSSQSSVKLSRHSRMEVHHVDPRPGQTLNSRDRRPIQDSTNSLRHLRSGQGLIKNDSNTLGDLRKNHTFVGGER